MNIRLRIKGNNSFIDLKTDEIPPMFIEYKWLTKDGISKTEFIKQFINRDLFNPDLIDLSQLQWRIKDKKITKTKVLEYLKSKEGKEALNSNKIIKLFYNYAEKINYDKQVTNINEILSFIETNNDWYNLIFK